MNKNDSTIDYLKSLLPFIGIFVSIILSWSNLSTLTSRNSEDIRDIKIKQATMNDQIIKIATIIDSAQKRGEITFNRKNVSIADSTPPVPIPTIEVKSEDKVSNQSAKPTQSKEHPKHTPIPTPVPTQSHEPKKEKVKDILNPILQIVK